MLGCKEALRRSGCGAESMDMEAIIAVCMFGLFRASTCYEFGMQRASTSTGAFHPGTFKKFTNRDARKLCAALKQAVNSFTFLK
jgi:hypothetical protein